MAASKRRSVFRGRFLLIIALLSISLAPARVRIVHAQNIDPRARLDALRLDSARVGDVIAHFRPPDRARAMEMAALAGRAASFYRETFGTSITPEVAALAPEDWFSEFPGVPYAVPWAGITDQNLFVPSSLTEGVLAQGKDEATTRLFTDFVMLHELGHVESKSYFRPGDEADYLPGRVQWLDELIATYYALAYVHTINPTWAETVAGISRGAVEAFDPPVISLHWSFMNDLPGQELSRVYGWYQQMLNLEAEKLFQQAGPEFLPALREQLPWDQSAEWTTDMLLPLLEEVNPQFQDWEQHLKEAYGH